MTSRSDLKVELKVLDPRLHQWGLPQYQSPMAAGLDLLACLDQPMSIRAGDPALLIPSGIAVLMNNADMMATIVPRSGMGHKKGLILGNTVGIIDADYTGQIQISVWNRNPIGSPDIVIEPGERIAQLLFLPILRPQFVLVDEFSESTERGGNGFGSTGSKG